MNNWDRDRDFSARRFFTIFIFFTLLVLPCLSPAASNPPQGKDDRMLTDELVQATSGKIKISRHARTGRIHFMGTDLQHPIKNPQTLPSDAKPEDASRAFLSEYGKLFGLADHAKELKAIRTHAADRGRSFVRFQQLYNGIPVLGAELSVQTDSNNNVISANGKVLSGIAVDAVPVIDASTATGIAMNAVAKIYGADVSELVASDPELNIYNPAMLKPGLDFNTLVWRLEISSGKSLPINELVLVNAHTGSIDLHFNQIMYAKNRRICDYDNNPANTLPCTAPVRTEGQAASAIQQVNNAYDRFGDAYDFYFNYHGRDGIDNAGMPIIAAVRFCTNTECPLDNAWWDTSKSQFAVGNGWDAADDMMAHEYTHGVTGNTSKLYYYYQSGAINESLSDLWGEFIDLANGRGNDSAGVRWLLGEDLPTGAIRSMSNPPAYNQPDKMSSPNYYCDPNEIDNGGVHFNSGVGNKAAYLLVDGGPFNGRTVTGLGITKVAKIYYEAQTSLLLSASDYSDLYNILQQACNNLIGTNGITAADCQEVQDAVDATEMNQQPANCSANEASLCPAGQVPNNLFFDNFEGGIGNWTLGAVWHRSANRIYATSGTWNLWGEDGNAAGLSSVSMNADVALPAGTSYLHFKHVYGFEDDGGGAYDGGVVEYSTNSGANWTDARLLFDTNGYNGQIAVTGRNNPLEGDQAFVRESNGYYSSRLNLAPIAGGNVRFRFRIGTDNSISDEGWYIDDVRIYTCVNTDNVAPNDVAGLNAAAGNARITFNWTNPGDIDFSGIRIVWKTTGFPANCTDGAIMDLGAATSYRHNGLTNGTMYYYRICTRDLVPNYSAGITTSATPAGAGAPDSPAGITLSNMTTWGPTVNWNRVAGANIYNIYRSTDGAVWGNPVGSMFDPNNSYADTTALRSNTTYQWTVSSQNAGGESAKPAAVTGRTALLKGWNMVSAPYNTTGKSTAGAYGSWARYSYVWVSRGNTNPDNNGSWVWGPSVIPGTGQIVWSFDNATVLSASGPANTPSLTTTLLPGWNMISNQTLSNMTDIGTNWLVDETTSLSTAVTNNVIGGALYWWDGSAYVSWNIADNPAVEPWKCYWILNMEGVNHTLTIN